MKSSTIPAVDQFFSPDMPALDAVWLSRLERSLPNDLTLGIHDHDRQIAAHAIAPTSRCQIFPFCSYKGLRYLQHLVVNVKQQIRYVPRVEARPAIASVVVSAVLMAIKFVAYYYTTSAVIFSDALESIVNVIASIVAGIFAFSRTSAGGR